ncbi:MAG: glycosyltransferase family 2 protein [Gammaproteobacteria bacterium]|nr:glycosyltransferase family 2 protein [Gammaproteobacteria bacterium]
MLFEILLWISISAIIYTYIIYPFILIFFSSLFQVKSDINCLLQNTERRIDYLENNFPEVAIIVAAYNEEGVIEKRINNLINQTYPSDKLNIYIGSDGSTDSTADIISKFTDQRIKKFIFQENRGKISVLNDLIQSTGHEEILVLSDANTYFNNDVVEKLVRHFEDNHVGAVCGELHLIDSESRSNKDSLYWKYERILKYFEARIGALLGANGANYAIRKDLYKPLPINTIVDDFTIVMDIAINGNCVKYDPEAIAIEEIAPDIASEFGRRVRIGIGNYQALKRYFSFLLPKASTLYFSYISHKIMRWLVPHFMLTALIINLLLIDQSFYYYTFILQLIFYTGCGLIYFLKNYVKVPGVMLIPVFLVSMNIALGVGFIKYITGNYKGNWKRTER